MRALTPHCKDSAKNYTEKEPKSCFQANVKANRLLKDNCFKREISAFQNCIFAAAKKMNMRPLQMVDTKTQYSKIKTEVDAAVIAVM